MQHRNTELVLIKTCIGVSDQGPVPGAVVNIQRDMGQARRIGELQQVAAVLDLAAGFGSGLGVGDHIRIVHLLIGADFIVAVVSEAGAEEPRWRQLLLIPTDDDAIGAEHRRQSMFNRKLRRLIEDHKIKQTLP